MKIGASQEKINSWYFNIYLDDLIVKWRISCCGCYVGFVFLSCLFLQTIIFYYLVLFYVYNSCLTFVDILIINTTYCLTKSFFIVC